MIYSKIVDNKSILYRTNLYLGALLALFVFADFFEIFGIGYRINIVLLTYVTVFVSSISLFVYYQEENITDFVFEEEKDYDRALKYGLGVLILMGILYRFYMGPLNSGTHIDEYYHLMSGMNILEEGVPAKVYDWSATYDRAAFLSYLVALFFNSFGTNLFSARLIPFLVGLVNIGFFYNIAKNVLGRYGTIFAVTVFLFDPIMVFIQHYVRSYIFVQFFALSGLYLAIKSRKNITEFSIPDKLLISKILLWILLFGLFWVTMSPNKYSVLLILGPVTAIFILDGVLRSELQFNHKFWIYFSLVGLIILSYVFNHFIQNLLIGGVILQGFSVSQGFYYSNISSIYPAMPFLLVVGIFAYVRGKNLVGLAVSLCAITGFFVHEFGIITINKEGLRFIGYLMPLFFLLNAKGIELILNKLEKLKLRLYLGYNLTEGAKLIFVVILALGFVVFSYPTTYDFVEAPQLPQKDSPEVKYKDWGEAATYLEGAMDEEDVLISTPAHGPIIYGLTPDYTLMKERSHDYGRTVMGENDQGELVYWMTNTGVIDSEKKLSDLLNKTKEDVYLVATEIRGQTKVDQWAGKNISDYGEENSKLVGESKEMYNIEIRVFNE